MIVDCVVHHDDDYDEAVYVDGELAFSDVTVSMSELIFAISSGDRTPEVTLHHHDVELPKNWKERWNGWPATFQEVKQFKI